MEGVLVSSRSQPDRRLAAAAAGRDRAAFTALVATYQTDLLRVCYVILGDGALAEDATQSAWIKAWQKLDQVRDATKVRSWLVAVAANEARQIARRRKRSPRETALPSYGSDVDPRLADLATVLARLGPDDRRLLSLRYVAELSSDEIGRSAGISAGAVRHRLMRLLARLREELT